MSWLSLMAQLGLNINPYVQGLYRAREEANKAGDKIGKDLKNKLWGAFGVGAAIGAGRKIFGDAREVERLHIQTQRSRQEIQAMMHAADKTGLSFSDIAGIIDGTATDVLPSMRDKVFELVGAFNSLGEAMDTNAVKSLTNAEDAMDSWLRRVRNKIGEAFGGLSNLFGYLTQFGNPKSLGDVLANAGLDVLADEFFGAPSKAPPAQKTDKVKAKQKAKQRIRLPEMDLGSEIGPINADSYAGVGGFIGNAAARQPIIDIVREQLKVQKKIEENTDPENRETIQVSPI